ncbi:gastrula zinc finger protein XlCGF26.1-like [Culicoides brevitarsis]|uniref:gastrula zinc finger protein XlCGF26.1-like n=1 Tax=Culicoides brevitarsis TaxID=469753 RepID=UPI00307C3A89
MFVFTKTLYWRHSNTKTKTQRNHKQASFSGKSFSKMSSEIPVTACRICFKEDDTVNNRISRLHKEIIYKLTQSQFFDGPNVPANMCKDCLNRLLEANYFRELILDSNRTFEHLVRALKPREEGQKLQKQDTKENVQRKIAPNEKVLGTEDVPEATEEQEVEVLLSDFGDTHEVLYKIEECTEEEQLGENLQMLEYSCCMCTFVFTSEEELRSHCQNEHTIQPLNTEPDVNQCRFCCTHFGNTIDVYNHKTCENCFECFATNEDLLEHSKTHEFDTLEVQAVEVARQLEQETIESNMPIVIVDRKKSKERRTSSKHLPKQKSNRIDTSTLSRVTNFFPCCQCPTSLTSESERSQHMLNGHGMSTDKKFDPKNMICVYCNRQFERMDQYYSHFEIPIRKQNRCTKCGRNFLSAELLQQHDINIHTSDTPSYNCQACNMSFATSNAYYSHNHRHHTTKPKYKCDICGDILITPSKLKEHMNVHLNIKNFVCNICNKTFIRKDNLRNHLRVHTGSKPYACDFCDKCFGHYTDMKRHRYIHTGQYPFKCSDCGKGFVKKTALDTHVKFHKGKPHIDKSKLRAEIVCTDDEIPENADMDVKIVVVDENSPTIEREHET